MMTYKEKIKEQTKDQTKDQLLGDSIKIRGFVDIKNGDRIIHAENKFVQSMLAWLTNICGINNVRGLATNNYWYVPTSDWKIYIGSNQTTPTAYNTTVLTSPIGVSPGTPPSSKSGNTTNPSNGVFKIIFVATWDPGAVTGTVGEMALYMRVRNALQSFGWTIDMNGIITETTQLVSRLASADGAFSPFVINTANPLSIAWTVQFSF